MISMPPVIHSKAGAEDPPYQGKMLDPFFPYQHPAEIMVELFQRHTPYGEAREMTIEAWEKYHERSLTEEEIQVIDGFESEWLQRMFPFNTPMDLLEFQIADFDYTGWFDLGENNVTDYDIVSDVANLWLRYKEEELSDEQKQKLLDRLDEHEKADFPEDFEFPRPVDLLQSLLDSGKMEMEVDKQFYDPELTTHGKKESRITATFSVDEKDKLELAQNLWRQRRRRQWTEEEYKECMDLMIKEGHIPAPKPITDEYREPPREDEGERQEYIVNRLTPEEIRQVAKDVFDGKSNIWFDKPEDGMVIMILSMMKIANIEDVGAIIGSNKIHGRVTSRNGGPYRSMCSSASILHREDIKQFIQEFNKISEFMSGFEAPPKPPEEIPEDERPWEKVNIKIRNVKENEEDENS